MLLKESLTGVQRVDNTETGSYENQGQSPCVFVCLCVFVWADVGVCVCVCVCVCAFARTLSNPALL